jgi:hypothetical protein
MPFLKDLVIKLGLMSFLDTNYSLRVQKSH